jgi:hypothetical protein
MKTTIKAILVITAFAFFACDKTDTTEGIDLTTTDLSAMQLKSATLAVNDVAVESVAEEANFETNFYGEYEHMLRQLAHFKGKKNDLLAGNGKFHYVEGKTPVVSIDKVDDTYPVTITIDYGTGIESRNGRIISGKVIIVISGPKGTDGSTRNITFENCKIDDISIAGTSTETFNGDNATIRIRTTSSQVKFTLADGMTLHRSGNNVHEWIKGLDTLMEREDDMIRITGSIEVISSTGDTYSRVITTPLVRLGDCKHPVEGIVTYSKNDIVVGELNYGDGTCDNLATLTTDGATVEIELKGEGKMPKAKTDGKHEGAGKAGKGKKGNYDLMNI